MRKLTIENWKELQGFIDQADYNEYNSNAMTQLMWGHRYEAYFETYEHFALVYTKMPRHEPVWLMPYCKKEYRQEAIAMLAEISKAEGIPYEIHSMTKEFKNWLMETYPLEFRIWDCYNARDYVYDRQQQETLSGKKMQKRRNHFHAFEKLYEGRYVYKPLETSDIPHIYTFLEEWKAQKKEEEYETIDAEAVGIQLFFEHWEELPLQGGVIYIDGKLEAFNIVSRLSHDTVQIHVEKANKAFRGLYIAILKLFLATLPDDIRYLNREDDMGLPELRKAKSDMQPIRKIQKFGSVHQTLAIHQADDFWLPKIRQLWESSFHEETADSTAFYFDTFYQPLDTWLLTYEDTLISMLQLRPMQIKLKQQQEPVVFIVGVATNKEYEGCGYMKLLMSEALRQYPQLHYALLQAYNWDIYKSLGFHEAYQLCRYKLDKKEYTQLRGSFQKQVDPAVLLQLYQTYTEDKEGYRIRDVKYYQEQFLPQAAFWKQSLYLYQEEGLPLGYVLLEEQEDALEVIECIYTAKEALTGILALLAQQEKKVYLRVFSEESAINGRCKRMTAMMVKELQEIPFPQESLFINENL